MNKNTIIQNKSLLSDHTTLVEKLSVITNKLRQKNNQHRAFSIAIGAICEKVAESGELAEDSELNNVQYLIEFSRQISNEVDELNTEFNNILFELEKDKN